MFNRQKLHYDEYRIQLEDGTEIKVTKAECFAPGEKPTADNPFKQRWYYSPDQKLAIRLPRSKEVLTEETTLLIASVTEVFPLIPDAMRSIMSEPQLFAWSIRPVIKDTALGLRGIVIHLLNFGHTKSRDDFPPRLFV